MDVTGIVSIERASPIYVYLTMTKHTIQSATLQDCTVRRREEYPRCLTQLGRLLAYDLDACTH